MQVYIYQRNNTEINGALPFLDVIIHRSDTGFLTSEDKKPIFTGVFT